MPTARIALRVSCPLRNSSTHPNLRKSAWKTASPSWMECFCFVLHVHYMATRSPLSVWPVEGRWMMVFLEWASFCSPFKRPLSLEFASCLASRAESIHFQSYKYSLGPVSQPLCWRNEGSLSPVIGGVESRSQPPGHNSIVLGPVMIDSVRSGRLHCIFREDIFFLAFASWMWLESQWWEFKRVFFLKNTIREKNIWSAFQSGNNHGGKCCSRYFPWFFFSSSCYICSLEVEAERKRGRKFFV